jgi:hypothetical protein
MHLFFADYFLPYDPTEVTHGQIIEGSDDLPEGGESMSEYSLGVLVSFFHMSIIFLCFYPTRWYICYIGLSKYGW